MRPRKFCYLDTETTGLTAQHGVIQIAGAIEIDGEIKEEFNFQPAPFGDDTIDDEALAISGRTRSSLEAHTDPAKVYQQFVRMLGKYVDKFDKMDKFQFVAYNSPFDNQMVRAFFDKNGDRYFGSWFHNPDLCVMRMAGLYFAFQPLRPANMKLTTVVSAVRLFGPDTPMPAQLEESAHDAKWDIEATRALFYWLREHTA